MGNINLTDIEEVNDHNFCSLYRLDDLYIASNLEDKSQVDLMRKLGVKTAIDMKELVETDFSDEELLRSAGIDYHHFPVSDISRLTFEELSSLAKVMKQNTGKKLLYCTSGNRVAAVIALQQALIFGHPKRRAFELAQKIGLTKESFKEKLIQTFNI